MANLCAFALIVNERSELLLCRRKKDGQWNLPGGHAEPGEPPWTTVAREVREELGIEIRIERLCGLYLVPESDDLVLTFACRSETPAVKPCEEIEEVRWFGANALPADMRARHAERARDAFAATGTVMQVQHAA